MFKVVGLLQFWCTVAHFLAIFKKGCQVPFSNYCFPKSFTTTGDTWTIEMAIIKNEWPSAQLRIVWALEGLALFFSKYTHVTPPKNVRNWNSD